MSDPRAALRDFRPTHEHFVGIDSDGCAFDTMELKHKECFIPATVREYGLQAASKYARETWEYVNLYSVTRGINRFPALAGTLELLAERPEVTRRGIRPRDTGPLRRFIDSGKPLGNPALREEIAARQEPELELALCWSEAVNRAVEDMVHDVPPFPCVRECLEALSRFADLFCISGTPVAALEREWEEHDLTRHVRLIVGQEVASKKEALQAAIAAGVKPGRALMVGDAPGDRQAARAVGASFFPIVPGDEEASWQRFLDEGIERFRAGTFAGAYEEKLSQDFMKRLPDVPPWKR
jgi:phosphoglycolate phosphatase-like HAD superfamily hydrolase